MATARRMAKRFWARLLVDRKLLFGVGFALGALIAVIVHAWQIAAFSFAAKPLEPLEVMRPYDFAYEKWLRTIGATQSHNDPDVGRYNRTHRDEDSLDPTTEAYYLAQRIPVACLVIPESIDKAVTVRDTWGRHCTKLFLFATDKFEANETVGVTRIHADSSFQLLCEALRTISDDKLEFHWVLVVTDNTYVLVENLRYFVAPLYHMDNHYLGHAMRFWSEIYNWGDAGYALSRGALKTLLSRFNSSSTCASAGRKYSWRNDDWYLGKYLGEMGVRPRDTRDHLGRGRFNGYSMKKLLFPGAVSHFERFWRDSLYLSEDGPKCCSNFAVTFHGIQSKSKMYQLEYMFHHLRAFYGGGVHGNVAPSQSPRKEAFLTWQERLKEDAIGHLFDMLLTTPKSMGNVIHADD